MYKLNSNKIRGLFAENRITHEIAAQLLGVARDTVHRKLAGKNDFTIKEICQLADIFKVSPAIFFENELPQQDKQKLIIE
ncbi:MAG: helix-turn-helix transcriptional regulator [Bacteroidales bacterium]|jgi:plasmid maintenance system antidote protein VapI|nr:helix-turn-helix transcriptional regulator [Candidatus Izemoplasmatales bacterium]NLF49343.1 transcriptional regulator [Acholeplasmataceae bacterium]